MIENFVVLFYGTLIWSILLGTLWAKIRYEYDRLALMQAKIDLVDELRSSFDWDALDAGLRQARKDVLSNLLYRNILQKDATTGQEIPNEETLQAIQEVDAYTNSEEFKQKRFSNNDEALAYLDHIIDHNHEQKEPS